jgi:hypothetical protein
MEKSINTCIQMFSGGRDSTLAAIRQARSWQKLVLVTVTAQDLKGLERVNQRLIELKPYLLGNTEWLNIKLPFELVKIQHSKSITCLSCHHSYLVIGAIIAEKYKANHLSLGYTSYQSNWTEQTPYAIKNLRTIMDSIGLKVILPAHDITSKENANKELQTYDLSEVSLEQKCVKQLIDPNLKGDLLHQEVDRQGKILAQVLANRHNMHLNIVDKILFDDLKEN